MVLLGKAFIGLFELERLAGDRTATSTLYQGLAFIVYAAVMPLLLMNLRAAAAMLGRHPEILVLGGLAMISALWSVESTMSLRRAFALAGTTAFALWMAIRFDSDRLIRLVGVALLVTAAGSIMAVILDPSRAVHRGDAHEGAWRGVFFHKNLMGQVAALWTGIALQGVGRRAGPGSWMLVLAVIGGIIMVLMSASKAALGTLVVIAGLTTVLRLPRLSSGLRLGALGVALAGAVAAWLWDPHVAFESLGGDVTLTGRTEIWTAAIDVGIHQHPWLGAGYRAFWLGPEGPAAGVAMAIGYSPPHGHSGLLDVFLELGVVGLLVTLLLLFRVSARVLGAALFTGLDHRLRLHVAILIALIMVSFASSPLLGQNDIFWLLFLVITFQSGQPSVAAEVPDA